jgi:hypothetical protein
MSADLHSSPPEDEPVVLLEDLAHGLPEVAGLYTLVCDESKVAKIATDRTFLQQGRVHRPNGKKVGSIHRAWRWPCESKMWPFDGGSVAVYLSNFAYSRIYLKGNGKTVLCPVRTKSTSIVGRISLNTNFEPLTATILRR